MNLVDKVYYLTALRVLQRMSAMQIVFILIHVLAKSLQAYQGSAETVYLEPDIIPSNACKKIILVTEPTETYKLRVRNYICERQQQQICEIAFQPGSKFIRLAMKLCAEMKDFNVTMCGNDIETWTATTITTCHRPEDSWWCHKFNKDLGLVYKAYNFCAFEGPIYINLEPVFDLLTFNCPEETRRSTTGTLMSYTHKALTGRFRFCQVNFKPPAQFVSHSLCIKFLHAEFSPGSPGLEIKLYGGLHKHWRFDGYTSPVLNIEYCANIRPTHMSVTLLGIGSLMPPRRPRDHAAVFEYVYKQGLENGNEKTIEVHADDDDKFVLDPLWFIPIIVGSLFCIICCYLCVCSTFKKWCKSIDFADDNENEPFDRDHAADRELNHNPDATFRIEALGPHATQPVGSRSGSPHHIPAPPRQPSAPPAEPSTVPPPSYESLFSTDR